MNNKSTRKTTVLLILGEPRRGGVTRLSILLANRLVNRYDVTIFTTEENIPYKLDDRIDIATGGGLLYSFRPGHAMKNLVLFPLLAYFREVDAIVNLSGAYPSSVALNVLKKNVVHYSHHVFDVDEMFPERGPLKRLYGRILKSIQRRSVGKQVPVLSNSLQTKRAVENRYDVGVYMGYPPINVTDFTPAEKFQDYVLISGRYHPDKKISHALDQLTSHKVIVAGSVADQSYFNQLRAEYPDVEFRRDVPEDEWIRLHQRAAAYVFPNPQEDFGMTAAEAMSCGVPTIVPDGAGITELVTHGVDGFVVDSDLSKLTARIVSAKNADEKLRAEARKTILDACSPDALAKEVAITIEIARARSSDSSNLIATVASRSGISTVEVKKYLRTFQYI
jgi:glycosyltransferase involved in cell wall biosynthesis